jgi:hypothetical protein
LKKKERGGREKTAKIEKHKRKKMYFDLSSSPLYLLSFISRFLSLSPSLFFVTQMRN